MNRPPDGHSEGHPVDDEEADRIADLLRPTEPPPELLARVQARIRQRSRGRFFGDVWSLGAGAPATYVVSAILALTVLVVLYLLLTPGGLTEAP